MKKLNPSFISKIKGANPVVPYDPSFPPDISLWFGLSYAQYLTVPRLVLESMSLEWQNKMAALLFEMDETFDWRPKEGRYWVRLKDSNGRFTAAPLSDYRRGRAEIEKLRKNPENKIDYSSMQWSKKDIKRIEMEMAKISRISPAMRGGPITITGDKKSLDTVRGIFKQIEEVKQLKAQIVSYNKKNSLFNIFKRKDHHVRKTP